MLKVLIVEDEDIIRRGLLFSIDWTSMGCVVVGDADNGDDGAKKILECSPDIVITDIKMPGHDGFEMLERVEGLCDFETVILTSHADFEYARKAIRSKVFDYLLKPVDEEQLKAIINRIDNRLNEKKTYSQIRKNVHDVDDLKIIDIEFYKQHSKNLSRYTLLVIDYIINNYKAKISIDDVARKLYVSPGYLRRVFKEETTHTFNDFLNQYRIQKSIELLLSGEHKVYVIADMLGFSDYKYFFQVFKQYMKCSPLEFLKSDYYINHKEVKE
jgi:two-component system, response regulator YesN